MDTEIQKPNKKMENSWLSWVLLAVIVLLAGGLIWWQFSKAQDLQTQLAQKQVEADLLKAENTNLKANETAAEDVDAGLVIDTDTEQILSVTDAYVRAPVAAEAEKFSYTVSDKTGDFAKVSVAVPGGGGYFLILKKVGDQWTVLLGGQDLPLSDVAEKYGLPAGYYQ